MSRPRTPQEFIHWLELGGGARWIRVGALLFGVLVLSLVVAWKQFHGPLTEATLAQADTGRHLAAGHGFVTSVNQPQAVAWLERRGWRFEPTQPLPELYQPPLYSLVVAAGLRLWPEEARARLFSRPPEPPDGFAADYFLLGLNLVLLWVSVGLTYRLARELFDARAAWLAALALIVSVPIWQQTLALNGSPLLMVLGLLLFLGWLRVERAANDGLPWGWLLCVGLTSGALFLADYPAGAVTLAVLAYAAGRFAGRARLLALLVVVVGFIVLAGPWMARNVVVAGHPVGLAGQDPALKAGDSTAEPAVVRATLAADGPELDARKLANKTLTSLQENLKSRLWSGGALWLAAFFVAGVLYPFRDAAVNRLRWWLVAAAAVALLAQAALNSGEAERLVAGWMAPLLIVFGAGFFLVLLGSNAVLAAWPRVAIGALVTLQALPLLHDALEPRRLHFQYPPYFPALFQGMRQELARREALGDFGLMADVPAGLAWYGQVRAWQQPVRMRDFQAVAVRQPIGALLLTPRTLDRPFFTDLNAKVTLPGALALPRRPDEWGEVYAGLLTGTMPRGFPLAAPTRLAENLYVLLNPTLPPPRGK
jgi:hypothetical protein